MYLQVLFEEKKTLLQLHFYVATLPVLKEYVLLFQSKDPLVHKLHDSQEKIFREFLSCYVKPQSLLDAMGNSLSGPQLVKVDLKNGDCLLSSPYIGEGQTIVEKLGCKDSIVAEFKAKVKRAYTDCGSYLQDKLPLASPTLRALSCLDPDARGSHHTLSYLHKLNEMLPSGYLSDIERTGLRLEVHK